ncbi:MAG: hypothetical protein ABR577_09555 [Pyrinomonadaceae bacterium]
MPKNLASGIAATAIFIISSLVFWWSPIYQGGDSKFSMLVSESLLTHGTFALDHYRIPELQLTTAGDGTRSTNMYQLEWSNSHIFYFFPPGTSLLSAPYVALMKAFGISPSNRDGTYNAHGEQTIQLGLAALLMAALTLLFYATSRMLLPIAWSALIAMSAAFSTQIWSTASRAMWSQTWEALLLGGIIWLLLAQETGRRKMNPVLLATLLAWLYFVRPTAAVCIIAITLYVFAFYRYLFVRYSLTGIFWLAGFVFYSWHNFGHALPSYYRASRLQFDVFWIALAGNLVSPSRGLLIYAPAVIFVFYLLARYRRELALRRLVWLALAIVGGHLFVLSSFAHWWGGSSYGARMTTDLIPWMVLLAFCGVDAMRRWHAAHDQQSSWLNRSIPLATGACLMLFGVFVNERGAFAYKTAVWNNFPANVDAQPQRVWNWKYPQFLAGLVHPPLPALFPLANGSVDFGTPDADHYIWYGWSPIEGESRWCDEGEAAIVFLLGKPEDAVLQIRMGAFLVPGKLDEQRVEISLNGRPVAALKIREPKDEIYTVAVPKNALRDRNVLVFKLPDAAAPKAFSQSSDLRLLSIRVWWLRFQTRPESVLAASRPSLAHKLQLSTPRKSY